METRLLVAYTLILLLAAGGAGFLWHRLTRETRRLRRRRHKQNMRERWLRPAKPDRR